MNISLIRVTPSKAFLSKITLNKAKIIKLSTAGYCSDIDAVL